MKNNNKNKKTNQKLMAIAMQKQEEQIFKINAEPVVTIFTEHETSEKGLTEAFAAERLEQFGENVLHAEKDDTVGKMLFRSFINPFSLILILLAIVSFLTDVLFTSSASENDKTDVTFIVILAMVLISGTVHFVQEFRANKESKLLEEMIHTTVSVKRDDIFIDIPAEELVVGDIIELRAGSAIPADVKFFLVKDMFVGQSALNGESEPVEKYVSELTDPTVVFDSTTIGFMGTSVVSGYGQAVVYATGDNTFFGQMIQYMQVNKTHENAFNKGVSDVGKILIQMMMVVIPIVFIVNGVMKQDWLSALLFSISIAVGLTPEMLPMIMTASLSKGSITMAKKKVIVKKMDAVQSLGAMDVLCTDKTGTLTEDRITVQRYFNVLGDEDEHVLRYAFLNSFFQTGLKNLLDLAIVEYAKETALYKDETAYEKIDEIPFDFNRRRMSVVIRGKKGETLITKGAAEEIMSICTHAYLDGEVVEINEKLANEFWENVDIANRQGMRVIAVAYKVLKEHEHETFSPEDENSMILDGFVALFDKPKESAKTAIAELNNLGVNVKIITGDNLAVAHTVAQYIGMENFKELQGEEISKMSFEELRTVVDETMLFAKVTPTQKAEIVRALQMNAHVVGFLGDGINDAPALDGADVGISVDTAVDIAREHADVVLLEKDLGVIVDGVREGRKIFVNIKKYIQMAASSNFGNIFTVLIASFFLPFLPMLPIQLLTQNLLYDFSQGIIPWDNVDAEVLAKPQTWSPKNLRRFMVLVGPISSIFDILTFVVLWFAIGANSLADAALFQTGWFTVGILTQLLSVYVLRTEHKNIFKTKIPTIMLGATFVVAVVALALPYTPIASAFGFVHVDLKFYAWLIAILIGYVLSLTVVKSLYIKKFHEWL